MVVVARAGDPFCVTTLSSIGSGLDERSKPGFDNAVRKDGVSDDGNQYGFVRKMMQKISTTERMRDPDMDARAMMPAEYKLQDPHLAKQYQEQE